MRYPAGKVDFSSDGALFSGFVMVLEWTNLRVGCSYMERTMVCEGHENLDRFVPSYR
jgi:hypothetical protein